MDPRIEHELLLTRRHFFGRTSTGIGTAALASLLAEGALADPNSAATAEPVVGGLSGVPHFAARAKRIIYLFQSGAPSQLDLFDYKPALAKQRGEELPDSVRKGQRLTGMTATQARFPVAPTMFNFAQHGESGAWVSELLPHLSGVVDQLCFVKTMHTEAINHDPAITFITTGAQAAGRPSLGAWMSYGLGSENRDLPAFVVINGGLIPSGGLENFSAGFLPARHQATLFKPQAAPIANLQPPAGGAPDELGRQRGLLAELDQLCTERFGHADAIESAIANYELAYRMQAAVPELANIDNEPEYLQRLYGLDHPFEQTRIFARECLLARRMVERGVRCVELTCPRTAGNDRWDAHSNLLKNHSENAQMVDQPIAALLEDLAARGLLDETLVVWAGEFGRTPFAQGSDGRDHNPYGFTIWLAGGGVRAGTTYGATDDYGYRVVENRTTIYDLHATLLHLLGLDHERLTFRFGGRDMRLTDVHGEIVHGILA